MSATLTGEVDELKSVVLRNPVTIKLSDAQSAGGGASGASAAGGGLTQYSIRTTEDDKFLLIYVILKLKLVKGKVLVFVNDTDRGYRLKLFLERFGIRSGVLNAELPFNSRYHAVQEFNRGVFNYLIATDESGLEGLEKDEDDEESEVEGERKQSKSQRESLSTRAELWYKGTH
jgi:ATP-dependent RNA helicase DDX56/DBP9